MNVPPMVLHLNIKESDDKEELVALCGKAMHLSKGAINLLLFYSSQTSGFRPSLNSIANEIKRDRRNVERARTQLVNNGICKLQKDKLFIDWNRVRLFSTLDPKLTSKKACIAPVALRSGIVATLEDSYKHFSFFDIHMEDLMNLLNLLSDEEWSTLSNFIHTNRNWDNFVPLKTPL